MMDCFTLHYIDYITLRIAFVCNRGPAVLLLEVTCLFIFTEVTCFIQMKSVLEQLLLHKFPFNEKVFKTFTECTSC